MNKGTDDIKQDQINEWSFPRIEQLITLDEKESLEEKKRRIEYENKLKELDAKQQEVNLLKKQYEEKLVFLENILLKIKNPLTTLDSEVVEILEDIIKKICKKLICKEINSDPQILNTVIDDLKELLAQKDNGMLSILLSPNDVKRFKEDPQNKFQSIKEEPNLKEGDIIIQSNTGEIRALIDERIEKVMSTKK